jgi:hypothetical protein
MSNQRRRKRVRAITTHKMRCHMTISMRSWYHSSHLISWIRCCRMRWQLPRNKQKQKWFNQFLVKGRAKSKHKTNKRGPQVSVHSRRIKSNNKRWRNWQKNTWLSLIFLSRILEEWEK